ncbi:response regulator transcription factor [Corticibacterium sp. UT-5YL-CI-8]|nr:response regulator transcription factor [Tianweitania sp. UT-5YL-CI-8]
MANVDAQFRTGMTGRTLLLLGPDNFIPDCNLIALHYQFPDIVVQRVAAISGLRSVPSVAVVLIDETYLANLSPSEETLIRQMRDRIVAVVDEAAPHFSAATYHHVSSNLVRGVLSMNLRLEIWLPTVELFLRGAEFVPSSLIRAHRGASKTVESTETSAANIGALTEREWQVLQMISAGWSNRVIALRCQLSENTIKVHVHNIIKKLNTSNRTAAAAIFFAVKKAGGLDHLTPVSQEGV